MTLPESIGFHSITVPDTKWALLEEFCYDNSKSNLATPVINKLTRVTGCSVNAGPVATPERRPHIERLFETIEEKEQLFSEKIAKHHTKDLIKFYLTIIDHGYKLDNLFEYYLN